MPKLALLRHGQSQWNLENRFTGWVDVNLTEEGEAQARYAGTLLRSANVDFSYAFSSFQTRAIRTLWLALQAMDCCWLPEEKSWRLNERHYGALTGLDKAETMAKHGEEQVRIWRRSFDIPPPAQLISDPLHPSHDRRYRDVSPCLLPDGESLAMTLDRVLPYWQEAIVPKLRSEHVLISAHGNSLRAIIKHVFNLSSSDIMDIEVPTGNPLLIELDKELKPIRATYLDPSRAVTVPELR
ncbi:2,3-diphosphoglycerate-dependent phosphoglycerate mutase [Candidatus Phycosocius spiralis]|uniref:2,3-bisphosphoglycerate-dependent phosphoglycerate mutase n=1 Tax=Candidatus Phycosocius spiralis TaxID=2815099 RepID=A0ABQ4PXD9_9PROT|nr:2,3-diphosphoglycerate-dependent phosphoglycerate mutase [Candidatus Phycosocius spiralis]GIU67662.1 2,3-bisphosphoglycerate-dependent phosphoglycerate mutase [Candidatus Phycosocius spiralis]